MQESINCILKCYP